MLSPFTCSSSVLLRTPGWDGHGTRHDVSGYSGHDSETTRPGTRKGWGSYKTNKFECSEFFQEKRENNFHIEKRKNNLSKKSENHAVHEEVDGGVASNAVSSDSAELSIVSQASIAVLERRSKRSRSGGGSFGEGAKIARASSNVHSSHIHLQTSKLASACSKDLRWDTRFVFSMLFSLYRFKPTCW